MGTTLLYFHLNAVPDLPCRRLYLVQPALLYCETLQTSLDGHLSSHPVDLLISHCRITSDALMQIQPS